MTPLVVWKLDRLGRSLRHLVDTVTTIADRGVGFRSLQEAIDPTTPGGKLVFHYGGGAGDDGGTGGGNGDLPFTGPDDTMLPAGTALLVAGGLLIAATRYRARHARR